MEIAIASDHGGYKLKQEIKIHLEKKEITVIDLGTNSEESVDYPEFGIKAGEYIIKNNIPMGIIICGTGIGISISANKVKGIRAALCHSVDTAKLAKQHNNANILALGGRILDSNTACQIVDAFLSTEFEGGRHSRRLTEIEKYENK